MDKSTSIQQTFIIYYHMALLSPLLSSLLSYYHQLSSLPSSTQKSSCHNARSIPQGYKDTARMCVEAALALVDLPKSEKQGGVYSPAAACAQGLFERLLATGTTWEVTELWDGHVQGLESGKHLRLNLFFSELVIWQVRFIHVLYASGYGSLAIIIRTDVHQVFRVLTHTRIISIHIYPWFTPKPISTLKCGCITRCQEPPLSEQNQLIPDRAP